MARPRGQIGVRVEAALRAERVLPVCKRQLGAVLLVDLGPDVEQGRLAVDDEPVEIEDDGGKGHRLLYGAMAILV